jgi:hypothetical protein
MIVMLLTTQNEADILKLNIEHHLSWGVDHIFVADNASTDGAQDVIRTFGSSASTKVFWDTRIRQRVRMQGLEAIRSRHRVEWAGVSDTDEFFWTQGTNMRELLADTPPQVVAVTFHQKLFIPTSIDGADGPVYIRQLYRSSSYESPLHLSYVKGKTFYRAAWLKEITSEHVCPELPHPPWSPYDPLIHHYMVQSEDRFVVKVKRLRSLHGRYRERIALRLGFRPQLAKLGADRFKKLWWSIFITRGEAGLREYYRNEYSLQQADIERHMMSGALIRDSDFADFKSRTRVGEDLVSV